MKNISGNRSCLELLVPILIIVAFMFALSMTPLPLFAADDLGPHLKGLSRDEILRMGEVMYRNGVLPSGEPLQSIVKGDILDEGGNLTCMSCHLRSGFGTAEGRVRTPPIDGRRLYSPLSKFKGIPLTRRAPGSENEELFRPAYTDETLARVIVTGDDPTGRKINDVMPIYLLNDRDAEVLVAYLKNLSTGPQPGVTEKALHFATVIAGDVAKEDREAMLDPLQAFIKNWRIPPMMERSMRAKAHLEEGTSQKLRSLSLSVWELKGPAETWRKQLDEYYQKDPVLALLGGIAGGEWAPIHRFCEDHRIPAVFPITDYPVISETDWYTLYLSKGLYQEGEAAARYLNSRDDGGRPVSVVQVFRKDRPGLVLSKAFQETWVGLGHDAPEAVTLDPGEPLAASFWKKLVEKHKHAVVLLWLDAKDFPALDDLAAANIKPDMIFASASLLGHRLYTLPEKERASVYLTYPYSLPQAPLKNIASAPSSTGGIRMPVGKQAIDFKMRSLFSVLSGSLPKMRSFVYRDFFLEQLENTADLAILPVGYTRLSFGTGQRYASKGCYVVQLSEGPDPVLIRKSEWVIY
jgi:hypothetical protein